MAVMTPSRQVVAVGCEACGTVAHVYVTVRTLYASATHLHLRVVPDPDDLVMLQLFTEAHRGPFVRVS